MTSLPLAPVKYIPIENYTFIEFGIIYKTKLCWEHYDIYKQNNAEAPCPGKGVGKVVSWAAAVPTGELAGTAGVLLVTSAGRLTASLARLVVAGVPYIGEQPSVTRQL